MLYSYNELKISAYYYEGGMKIMKKSKPAVLQGIVGCRKIKLNTL